MSVEVLEPEWDGNGIRVGVVQSRFNAAIVEGLRAACVEELLALGVADEDVLVVTVPGALEIPLALQKLALTNEFDALIALGAVIRGETYHFDLVANESAAGVSRVGLEFSIPIANAILTTEDEAQAHARMQEKGRDAARVAVEMVNLTHALQGLAEPEDGDEE